MRIAVIAYLEPNETVPDVVVPQVARALRRNGHTVRVICEHDNIARLVTRLARFKPNLVFNLMEMFADNWNGDVGVVALLDVLRHKYTGGGPGEFTLAGDKVLSKRLLSHEGIRNARYQVYEQGHLPKRSTRARFPLMVKPSRGDASLGIDGGSVVATHKALRDRVRLIHHRHRDAALVEEYIDGREFFVGVIGNHKPLALPPLEVDFSALPQNIPRIMSREAKFDPSSQAFIGTRSVVPKLPKGLLRELQAVSIAAYKALRVRDYGRVDLRMDAKGKIFVIEVNPSCYLEEQSEFAMAARAAGIGYEALIDRIVKAARERVASRGVRL